MGIDQLVDGADVIVALREAGALPVSDALALRADLLAARETAVVTPCPRQGTGASSG